MTELPGDGGVSPRMRVGRCEVEQDLYAILGISAGSSEAAIRRAHRKLALEHHPDRDGDTAAMKRVNLAASVLLNAGARARYDHLRGIGAHLRPSPPPAPRPQPTTAPRAPHRDQHVPRATASRPPSPFVGLRSAVKRGQGISPRLFLFAFVATVAVGCVAQSSGGPVPVSSPSYRIPEPPRMATLWGVP